MAKKAENPLQRRWEYAHEERIKVWEAQARKNYAYYNGLGHWTFAEQQLLWKESRPPYRLNFMFKWMNVISGNERQHRNEIWIYPMEGGDVRMAGVYNYIYKYIKKENNLDWRTSGAAMDGFLTGEGWLKLFVEFDDEGQPQIKIRQVNPLLMYHDPDGVEYDQSDWKDIFESVWIHKEDLVKQYPKKENEIKAWYKDATAENDLYVNRNREMCRVLDAYKREYKKTTKYWDSENGKLFDSGGNKRIKISHLEPTIKQTRLFGDVVFEEYENPYGLKDFPHIYFAPYYIKGAAVPLADQVCDVQDIVNKSMQQMMDILNRQPKVGGLYEESAVEDPEVFEAFRNGEFKAVPDGVLTGNRIHFFDPPQYPAAHSQTLRDAIEWGKYILSITDVWEGDSPGRVESALGIQLLLRETAKGFAGTFDNIRLSQITMGRRLLEMVNILWSTNKVLRLLGEDGDLIELNISPAEIQKSTLNRTTGEPIEVEKAMPNLLEKGKYDFTIDLNQPSTTTRQWNMYTAMEIAKLVTDPYMQSRLLAMVIDMTDFPRKDEWKQIISEAGQMGQLLDQGQLQGLGQALNQAPSQQPTEMRGGI